MYKYITREYSNEVRKSITPPYSDAPPRTKIAGSRVTEIHNSTAQIFKSLRRQWLRKEISVVVVCVHKRNDDLLRLDHVPNEEVPASNMFRPTMMFWII